MAPVSSLRKKSASAGGKGALPSTKPNATVGNDSRISKKDRRREKHATLVSKIEKDSQKPKRRRASKKLAANLDSLADALPETEAEMHDPAQHVNVIKQKTLRHKPGAMKKKEQLEKLERDRFAKNMAQMSSLQAAAAPAAPAAPASAQSTNGTGSVSNRWAALRGFISQTMEQQPAFMGKK